MNIYQKIANYLTRVNVVIHYESAKKNHLGNLLINRFEDIVSKNGIKFKFNIHAISQNPGMIHMLNPDNVNYVKNNPTSNFIIRKNGREIVIIENTIYFKGERASIVDAFEDEKISFLLAFVITQKLNLKLKSEDLKPPLKDVNELINERLLNETFKSLKVNGYEMQMKTAINETNQLEKEIGKSKIKIKKLEERIKILEKSLLFDLVENKSEKITNFILKHKLINKDSISVNGDKFNSPSITLEFNTNDIFAYKLNLGYLEKSKNSIYPSYPLFREHLDDIIKGNTKIYVGKYRIKINISENSTYISHEPLDRNYQNPHAKIHCMGTAKEDFEAYLQEFKIIPALTLLFEHLQSINFGDQGSFSTPTHCKLYKEGEIVYDSNKPRSRISRDAIDRANDARADVSEPQMSETISTTDVEEIDSEPESRTETTNSNETR